MKTIGIKVSKRGYIVLPASLRKEMNIEAGTRVLITRDQNKLILQPVSSFTEKLKGLTARSFGKTAGEIDEYFDKERKDR